MTSGTPLRSNTRPRDGHKRLDSQTIALRALLVRLAVEDLHSHQLQRQYAEQEEDEDAEIEELTAKNLRFVGRFALW